MIHEYEDIDDIVKSEGFREFIKSKGGTDSFLDSIIYQGIPKGELNSLSGKSTILEDVKEYLDILIRDKKLSNILKKD